MSEPRIVTPQEAQERREATDRLLHLIAVQGGETQAEEWLAAEVVAERDRTRAAVVKALKWAALDDQDEENRQIILGRASAINKGAPL